MGAVGRLAERGAAQGLVQDGLAAREGLARKGDGVGRRIDQREGQVLLVGAIREGVCAGGVALGDRDGLPGREVDELEVVGVDDMDLVLRSAG